MGNETELLKAKLETRKELCDNLQQRIDKAIEYIENQEDYFNNYPLIDRNYLLEILGDKENEI